MDPLWNKTRGRRLCCRVNEMKKRRRTNGAIVSTPTEQRKTFYVPVPTLFCLERKKVCAGDGVDAHPCSGETRTDGEVVDALGRPGAAREVGSANAGNVLRRLLCPGRLCHIAVDVMLDGFKRGGVGPERAFRSSTSVAWHCMRSLQMRRDGEALWVRALL